MYWRSIRLVLADVSDVGTGDGPVYRRIARNSIWLAGGTVGAAFFTMVAVALSARALDARQFGILVLLQSASMALRAATSFSTQQPVIKLGADAQAAGDMNQLSEIISMGLIVDLVASLFAFVLAMILIEACGDLIGLATENTRAARIFAGALLFMGFPVSNGIFRLFNSFGRLSLIQAGSAAVNLGIVATLFATRAGFEAFLWAWALFLAFAYQLQLWSAIHLVRKQGVPLRFPRNSLASSNGRLFLQYCWTTWGTSSAESFRSHGDSLLVGAIVSVEAAGMFNVAKQITGVLRKFNMIYASTVFPEITRFASRGDVRAAEMLKRRMMVVVTFIGSIAVLATVWCGEPVLRLLFGERFASAHITLIILTAAAAAQLMSHTPSMYVQVYKGPKRLLALFLIATAAFAASAIPLTMSYSMPGMAVAQLIFGIVLILACELALRSNAAPPQGAIDHIPLPTSTEEQ
jgi:O-antigen/teichoic acid export membrane protein